MNDLDLIGDEDEIVPEAFAVDSMEDADWAMRKAGRAQAHINRFRAVAEKYLAEKRAELEERLQEVCAPHERTIERMTELLKPWGDLEIAQAGGKKSVKLLSGQIGYRSSPPHLEVEDEAAAVAWLRANGHSDMVRVKEEVKKDPVKSLIKEKGEVPEGCELKQGDIKFYIDPIIPLLEGK